MGPWHQPITRILGSYVFGFSPYFLWGIFLSYVYMELKIRIAAEATSAAASPQTVPFLIVLLGTLSLLCIAFLPPFLFVYILNRARNWLFPEVFFALGQGERRYDFKEKMRWVVVALILSLLTSAGFVLANRII